MADVLIRDIPPDVLAAVDAHAVRLGLSRVEYIRRQLASDASTKVSAVTAADLRLFQRNIEDLADEHVMREAWR